LYTTRKVRLHARVAEALEELYGPQAEAHAAELAFHFSEAEAVTGPDKLVQYSLLAGEKALEAYAWEDAMALFQRGVVALEGNPVDSQIAALLFGLGRAESSTIARGQTNMINDNLETAFNFYFDSGDVNRAVAVALEFPGPPFLRSSAITQLLSRALSLVPSDSHQAGRLLARHGSQLGSVERDYLGARSAFDQALEIARREGDTLLEMRILTDASRVINQYGDRRESLEFSAQAVALAPLVNDPLLEVPARWQAHNSYLIIGDLQRAKEQAEAALPPAEKSRHPVMLAVACGANESVARVSGDFESAKRFTERGLAVSPWDIAIFHSQIVSGALVGDLPKIQECIDQSYEHWNNYEGQGFRAAMVALTWYSTGLDMRLDSARREAQETLSAPAHEVSRAEATAALGLIGVYDDNQDEIRRHYEAFKELRQRIRIGLICDDRMMGILARSMGEMDLAADHFQAALSFCNTGGFRPELAWSCCDFADALLARESSGDRERAMSLLDESLAISRELSMRPLMERVLSRRDILKA
ncbi:MAG: hypothetical protein ACE5Q6_23415, partial [Dehalococcoidia bacterium]